MKTTSLLIITVSALLLISGCSKQQSSAPTQGGNAPATGGTPPPMGAQVPSGSEAGLTWTTPNHWQMGEEKPMRVATYIVGEGAECAVHYFGPGEGGDVESNIERWYGQFKQPDGSDTAKRAKRETRQINGIKVTVVDIPGTYTSPGGPMMTSQGEKPNYRMLGAIAEGPNGNVFFKFVGPEATIAKEKKNFDVLLNSLKKSS